MTKELFDRKLRALRRDRAARCGPDLFLVERAFEECLDRLRDINRTFASALLVGCPSPEWKSRLGELAKSVVALDPGGLFAAAAGGEKVEEDRFDFGIERFDLCLAVGTLDTVNELPLALRGIRECLRPDSPVLGAIAGGNSLPSLRTAMIEADRQYGRVNSRVHPRIAPPTLAALLSAAGLTMPVVDVDRIELRYADLAGLVRDLRAMGATNVLADRPPAISRPVYHHACRQFEEMGEGGKTAEIVDILHFIAWRPAGQSIGQASH